MASPAVTYIFSNSTVADATQVNQNFTDLINGVTDTTRDLSVKNITLATTGTLTANGNAVLGSSTSYTINATGTFISSLVPNAALTYNLGSATFPWQYVYVGQASKAVQIAGSASGSAAAYKLSLPPDAGTQFYRPETDGSGTLTFTPIRRTANALENVGLTASVSVGVMTINLKTALNAADPSATDPVHIAFRNATDATGQPVIRNITAATTLSLVATTSLGFTTTVANYFYVYAVDNAGTVELFASAHPWWEEGTTQTTSTSATSPRVLFGANVRTNVAVRLLGRIKAVWTSAGTGWSTISQIQVFPFEKIAIVARAYKTSNEAFASSDTPGQPAMGGTLVDTALCMNNGTYTVPTPGRYRVSIQGTFAEATEGCICTALILVNASTVAQGTFSSTIWDNTIFNATCHAEYTSTFATGDTIVPNFAQKNASGGNRNLAGEAGGRSTWINIERLGA